MPSIIGYVTEEQKEWIQENLIETGKKESNSEVVQDAIDYYLYNHYDADV